MFMSVAYAKLLMFRGRGEPLGLYEPVRQELRAWPWYCDALGHVNNARYLDLADLGRMSWLARRGLLRTMIRQGHSFLVAGVSLTYRRPIPRMAHFALETQVVDCDERWLSFSSTFLLKHAGRELVAARGIVRGQVRVRNAPANPLELVRSKGAEPERSHPLPADADAALRAQDICIDVIRARDGRA